MLREGFSEVGEVFLGDTDKGAGRAGGHEVCERGVGIGSWIGGHFRYHQGSIAR